MLKIPSKTQKSGANSAFSGSKHRRIGLKCSPICLCAHFSGSIRVCNHKHSFKKYAPTSWATPCGFSSFFFRNETCKIRGKVYISIKQLQKPSTDTATQETSQKTCQKSQATADCLLYLRSRLRVAASKGGGQSTINFQSIQANPESV